MENARFLKKAYKSFTIEKEHPDDPACMYEAISIRIARFHSGDAGFQPLPDLIRVDGAEAQVAAVNAALSDGGVSIPVFGMIKDAFHKTRCLTDGEREISIAHDGAVFQFIYGIQEEVHRFSLSRMDAKRRKKVKTSSLTKISGVGEKKAGWLLKELGSPDAVKSASVEALASVKGISARDAVSIYEYYHKKDEEES